MGKATKSRRRSAPAPKRRPESRRKRRPESRRKRVARASPFCELQYPGECRRTGNPYKNDPYACRFDYKSARCKSRFRDVDPYGPYPELRYPYPSPLPYDPLAASPLPPLRPAPRKFYDPIS